MSRAKPPEERKGHDVPAIADVVINVAWHNPEPPDTITDVTMWNAIWELGGPSGVYHPVADYGVISRYIEFQERRTHLTARLNNEGWTEVGSQGQQVQHPAARMLSDVEAKLVPLEDRLGLSPQARHTVQVGHVQAKNALEKWLEGE